MRVRVRLESTRNVSKVETLALLNTGFTSSTLDIHLPVGIAKRLGLWPPPPNSVLESLDTAGGEVMSYFVPDGARLAVVEGDGSSKEVTCN